MEFAPLIRNTGRKPSAIQVQLEREAIRCPAICILRCLLEMLSFSLCEIHLLSLRQESDAQCALSGGIQILIDAKT